MLVEIFLILYIPCCDGASDVTSDALSVLIDGLRDKVGSDVRGEVIRDTMLAFVVGNSIIEMY